MTQKSASILDYVRPGLDGTVWSPDATLLPEHKDQIVEHVMGSLTSAGYQSPQYWMKFIKIVGSMTTYQYLPTSDLDVHIEVDLPAYIKHENPLLSEQEAHDTLDAIRKEVNKSAPLLGATQHPIEIFFETPLVNPEGLKRSGAYDVLTDEWLEPPIAINQDYDLEESQPVFVQLAEELAGDLDQSFGKIKRNITRIDELYEVINTWPQDKKDLFAQKIEKKLEVINQEISKLIQMRDQIVLDRRNYDPESQQEISFKYLQRFGYMVMLTKLKELVKDDGKITEDELPQVEKILDREAADSKYLHGYCAEYAIALSEKLGKPIGVIRGYFDEDGEERYEDAHAFVYVSETVGADAKGERPIADMIKEAAWVEQPKEVSAVKVSPADLEFSFGNTDEEVLQEARSIVKQAAKAPRVTQVETFTVAGHTVKVVVNSDVLQNYLEAVKLSIQNPSNFDLDASRRAAHDAALENALEVTDFKGEDPYLYASNVRDAISNFAEDMFNKKYGSLKKTASAESGWLSPDGSFYPLEADTHYEWIENNSELIQNQIIPEIEDIEDRISSLIDSGWTRVVSEDMVSNAKYQFDLQVSSLSNLPSSVDKVIAEYFDPTSKKPILVEDNEFHSVSISDPFPTLQEAVNTEFKYKIKAEFLPSIGVHAPNNEWQSDSDLVIPNEVEPVSDEETYNNPAAEKPRKGIWRSLIDWFIKRKEDKEASVSSELWFDPNGKQYPVKRTHKEWIVENFALLHDQYGINVPESEHYEDLERPFQEMLKQGWVRVGAVNKPSEADGFQFVVQVYDINKIPDFMNDFVVQTWKPNLQTEYGVPGIAIDNFDGSDDIIIDNPFPTLQKAVRKTQKEWPKAASQKTAAWSHTERAAWIAPDAKVYPVERSHVDWYLANKKMLKEKYDFSLTDAEEQSDDPVNWMLQNDWIRLAFATRNSREVGLQVADVNSLPAFLEDLIWEFNPKKLYIEDMMGNDVILDEAALHRGLSKSLQKYRHKAASFSLQYWLDPQGQEYEGDALQQENAKPEQLIRSGWTQVLVPSDRQGVVLVVDELEFVPDFLNNFLAKTVQNGDPVTVKDTKGSTVTLRYPFKNIRGLIKKYLYAPEQEKAAALGSQSIWISPDGKEHQAHYSHADWAFDNADLLSKNYGIHLAVPETLDDLDDSEVARYHADILDAMLAADWVRVFIYGGQINFQIADMQNPPSHAENFFDNHAHAFDTILVADGISGDSVEILKPDLGFARGIAHALRTQNQLAASLKTASAASDIVKLINETGGATYNLDRGNLAGTNNYAVAIFPQAGVILDHIPNEQEINDFIDTNSTLFSSDASLGAWVDNNKTYLDVVATIPDKERAIALAKRYNQIAIFDLKNFVEIPTGGTGEAVKESGFYGPEDGHPKEYYTHTTDEKNLGDPNQRFMGRPKGNHKNNMDVIIKWLFENEEPVEKKAFTVNGFWVAPDGKSFDVRSSGSHTHGDWVAKNANLLAKYGIKDAKKRDYFEVAAEMLQKGWARVGDSQRNKYAAIGVEVNNIKSIPSGVDNVLATFLQDGDVVIVADLNGDWGEVTYPFKSLQSAVNKARMGRRGSAYTQQEMEEIYVDQHEMHDNTQGIGGFTTDEVTRSTTDYPMPKDIEPVRVFLDKLDKTKTPPIPSYEVSWWMGTPRE